MYIHVYIWRLFNKNLRLENHPRRFIIFETLAAPGKPPNNPIPSMWVDPMDAVTKIFLQTHFWQGKLFSNVGKNYKAPGKCKPNVTLVFFDVTQILYRCSSAFKHTLKKNGTTSYSEVKMGSSVSQKIFEITSPKMPGHFSPIRQVICVPLPGSWKCHYYELSWINLSVRHSEECQILRNIWIHHCVKALCILWDIYIYISHCRKPVRTEHRVYKPMMAFLLFP